MTLPRAFCVSPTDNVATMLDSGEPGPLVLLGSEIGMGQLVEPIGLGHKVALRMIPSGEPIIKFGVAIGRASSEITAGAWVHLHNCASNYDERSQTLDLHTGAATDTEYV
jgi:altronate dehydratase small subunit